MKGYYHWCCKGLQRELLFYNEDEFIAGMNRIAVCYLYCLNIGKPVRILAFCLLNNHFHFVLYGEEEDTALFMEHYRFLTAKWIRSHRGERLHESIDLGHWPATSQEVVRNKVVYTLRQILETGVQLTPHGYRWCSARLLFADKSLFPLSRKVGELSTRAIQKLTYSEVEIPASWSLLADGTIWPGDYTEVKGCERLFSGVKDYMFCMNNGNIDKTVNAEMMGELPSIPDTEIKDKADDLARKLYVKNVVGNCSAEERLVIARYLRKDLHCSHKQLARIVKMDENYLRKLI